MVFCVWEAPLGCIVSWVFLRLGCSCFCEFQASGGAFVSICCALGHHFGSVLGSGGRLGSPWDPIWHLRDKNIRKTQKMSPTWEPFGTLFSPMRRSGAPFWDTREPKGAPKGSKLRFYDIVKIVVFLCFFRFLRLGGPSGAPNGRLERLRGATWDPLGGQNRHHFGRSNFKSKNDSVYCGLWERSAARRGPLELKLRELCMHFAFVI